MKKKMLFMAAIAGLVTLGSCVKDDVSGSVEAVRNAKANELNGYANEANAHAELYKAQAAHEAAMQAADVAYRQAEAAEMQAQAQIRQAQAQHDAETLAGKIAQTLAQYEAGVAQANVNALQAANNLAALARQASNDERTYITSLINNYYQAYADYVDATEARLAAEMAMKAAQVSAENADEAKAVALQDVNEEIAKLEALITALGDVEKEGMSDEEAWKEWSVKKAELVEAQSVFENSEAVKNFLEAAKAYTAKRGAFRSANSKISKLNSMIADEVVTNVIIDDSFTTAAARTTAMGTLPAPATGYTRMFSNYDYDDDGDGTDDTFVLYAYEIPNWWANANESYFTVTDNNTRYSATYPYANYSTVRYEEKTTLVSPAAIIYTITHNEYDANGNLIKTWLEDVWSDPVYSTSTVLNMSGNSYADGSINFDVYRPNENAVEGVKALFDADMAKAALGSESDTHKTTYKDANGTKQPTYYANVKIAEKAKKDNDDEIKAIEDDSKAYWGLSEKNDSTVAAFYDKLNSIGSQYWDEDAGAWKPTSYTYDATTYTPQATKKTGTGKDEAYYNTSDTGNEKKISTLYAKWKKVETDGSASEKLAAKSASADAYADLRALVKDMLKAQADFADAATKYPKYDNKKEDGTKVTAARKKIPTLNANIAAAKEDLAKAKERVANIDAEKAAFDAAVEAASYAKYEAAAKDIQAAADNYDAAAIALFTEVQKINAISAEIAALETAATQDLDEKIAQATQDLAQAKTLKARLENANTQESIIMAAQVALDKAIEREQSAEAKLLIATQAIKDLDIDFSDLDGYNDEEPAEDPSDEPAGDEPAGDEPAGDEPAGDEPAGDEPAGDE